ncbi:MAG: hypothetical protein HYX27_13960 [Acidobacteria bacterium]|nr:hypothetical protein [Acidobacteriota bacterium]
MLSKRQFLQAAGITVAGRLAAPAAEPSDAKRKVILVTFGGGVRYAETFTKEGLRNIPRLAELQPRGHFFRDCRNLGVLSHFNSTGSLVTGQWQRVDDFGFQPPASPTIFEAFRQQRKAGLAEAWAICTNKSFSNIGSSAGPGANVVLPKQLLLEAVKDIVARGDGLGVADRTNVQRRLETILQEGYEGVGWTIFKGGRQIDRKVRETLTHALVEYIHGPEAPTSGDELTFFIAREVMREFAPPLTLVNFWDMDVAHWGSYSLYLQAVTRTDRLVGMLWDEVCSNPNYKDRTTMLVLPELGRDGDINAANGFLNHRSGDASCRNMWMLALGAGVDRGETERPVAHIDVAATAAKLLGVKFEAAGQALREIV